ncbi:MAG: cytochrome C oxidase subunit IV family protein [Acidimicrobiales bacterium]
MTTDTDISEPAEPAEPAEQVEPPAIDDPHATHERTHPPDSEYIKIFLILAAITAAEVATYYVDLETGFLLLLLLIPMMIAKFIIVAMFFMHLRYDSKVFTAAFVFGIVLAAGVYIVALATFRFFG